MRNAWPTYALVLVAAVLAAVGCDSTEPERVTTRSASVFVEARADVTLWDCYEVWVDNDNDGNPDEFVTNFCEPTIEAAQRLMPWNYAISISIIPKGGKDEHVVTSVDGIPGSSFDPGNNLDDFVSVTESDANISAAAPRANQDNIYFLNGKRVSPGSPVFLTINGFPVDTPNILTASPSFDFEANSGDTIIVRARKQAAGQMPPFLPQEPDPHLLLSAGLVVGGAAVTPAGSSTSTSADKSGFTFSFAVP